MTSFATRLRRCTRTKTQSGLKHTPCRAGFGFGFVPAIVQLNWVYPPVHRAVETSVSRACRSSDW